MTALTGLARKIVSANLLKETQAIEYLEQSYKEKTGLVRYLIHNKLLPAITLAKLASTEYGIPLYNLKSHDLQQIPKIKVMSQTIKNGHALPIFKRANKLFIAISDPSNLKILDDIKFQTGDQTEPIIVEDDILQQIAQTIEDQNIIDTFGDIENAELEALDISHDDNKDYKEDIAIKDDAPIVRFVNKMLLDAIHGRASDIHFEPYEKMYRIRIRQDGILYEHAKPPPNLANRIAARIKVMSQLDISERRVPQDGRFKMRFSKNHTIDFRVSTCPTLFGEKIVMRILDPTSAQLGIDALGYEDFQKEIFLRNIRKPQGMVLVTGPTGSGKTVSLYTALNILNTTETNISTVEDPIELNINGINQVNLNVKAGLTFSAALKAFLRQDPDIIMVGEIRDLETAEISIKAAQTGHLVLSTLHTNSAADTLIRLMNMGIPSFNLAASISLVVAQRLCRLLCDRCKEIRNIPKPSLLEAGFTEQDLADPNLKIFGPKGCSACNKGYKGRIGIYEIMEISDEIGEIIMRGGNSYDIAKQAEKEGMWTIRKSGINKILKGLTSLEEVIRVTTL